MSMTQKADWIFIALSTIVDLAVTACDFQRARREGRRFGALNVIGLAALCAGLLATAWAMSTPSGCASATSTGW